MYISGCVGFFCFYFFKKNPRLLRFTFDLYISPKNAMNHRKFYQDQQLATELGFGTRWSASRVLSLKAHRIPLRKIHCELWWRYTSILICECYLISDPLKLELMANIYEIPCIKDTLGAVNQKASQGRLVYQVVREVGGENWGIRRPHLQDPHSQRSNQWAAKKSNCMGQTGPGIPELTYCKSAVGDILKWHVFMV